MKLFAVILVFAFASGGWSRTLPQADSWETAVEKFQDYFTNLNSKTDEFLQEFRRTQISRDLDSLMEDSLKELKTYRDDMETKLAPVAQEAAQKLGRDLDQLGSRLQEQMQEAREQLDKYAEELQTMMEQNVDDVKTRLSTYTRKMKKRLNKDTHEIKR
uniref:Uncharacterized protein n=1 Tax=Knipowitschia caucasica TaxID=637954 RepID=A0AAV2K4D1_KNICA